MVMFACNQSLPLTVTLDSFTYRNAYSNSKSAADHFEACTSSTAVDSQNNFNGFEQQVTNNMQNFWTNQNLTEHAAAAAQFNLAGCTFNAVAAQQRGGFSLPTRMDCTQSVTQELFNMPEYGTPGDNLVSRLPTCGHFATEKNFSGYSYQDSMIFHQDTLVYPWMIRENTGEKVMTRTREKYRSVYTDFQRVELEKEYHFNNHISKARKLELVQEISLSDRQIKIWFQNRRARARKLNRVKSVNDKNGEKCGNESNDQNTWNVPDEEKSELKLL